MQQLHSITGASPARFFPVGCDGSSLSTIHNSNAATSSFMDRRLRPQLQHHQIVKCPRCDSPNTKFCYYNNYNLSQPRHFCKSCRRYWTKGGVLRNVPVGGGCRKSKRSNSTSSPSSTSSSSTPKSSKLKVENHRESRRCPRSNSRSSSDSSSLTVVAPAIPCPILLVDSVPTIVEADQGKIVPTETGIDLPSTMPYEFPDYSSSTFSIPNQGYEQNQINANNDHHVFAAVEEMSLPDDMGVGFLDQTVPVDLPPLLDGRIGNSDADLTGLDWQGCLDPTVGFFDAGTSTVAGGDQGLFWPLV